MRTHHASETILNKQEIMYVDDERGVREGWKRFLTAEDRKVTTASDGDSAIRGLAGHPVDLVISDLRMPGADGLELLEWIQNNEPETRFILVTGFGGPEVEQRARELGAFGYLEKPVAPDKLEEIALAALRGEQSSWAHAVVADDPALASELAAPVIEEAVAVEKVAAAEMVEEAHPGTIRELGRLMVAPFVGLAYIMFLPVIGIAAAIYAIGMALAKALAPTVKAEIAEPVIEPTTVEPGTARELGRLMVSPLVGLIYIMFLPVIGIAAAIYAIGMALAKALRPAVAKGIAMFEEASVEPVAEPEPGTLREFGRLITAPFVGLIYIMFLPVIGIAAAIYAIGMALAKALRPAVETGTIESEQKCAEPVVEATPIEPGSLRDFGRLVAAPLKGLAYIVCMPAIAIAVVAYGIGVRIVRVFRHA